MSTDGETATERAACVLVVPMIVLALTVDAERSTRIRTKRVRIYPPPPVGAVAGGA